MQSLELGVRLPIVGFVFSLGLFEELRVWFSPNARRAKVVRHSRS